jgi:hypothetical protein
LLLRLSFKYYTCQYCTWRLLKPLYGLTARLRARYQALRKRSIEQRTVVSVREDT